MSRTGPGPQPTGTVGLFQANAVDLTKHENKAIQTEEPMFQDVCGVLLYVSQDRIDIQHAARSLSRFRNKTRVEAEQAVKHLILYLEGTASYGILLP